MDELLNKSMQPSEQIKAKLDIVDVLKDYIQLTAAGMNFRARCPFHQEKSPSFMVSPEKQIWHCFGCGKGGDIFSFIMEMEGLEFVEVLRLLATKAGVTLERQDPKLTSQRNKMLDMTDLARKYYHQVFLESKEAESARQYLQKRGLTKDTIEEWQIGYSPDAWENLTEVLKKRGYKDKEIFDAGLSVKRNKGEGYFDRFRGRIMFPLNDINSNTVGFTARVSPEKEATETMGKYVNSPQTVIYDKSRLLFGLDKAKQAIKSFDQVIVVEGQMDVITAHQHGFKNVVASSGTALTTEQVALVKRFTNSISLAFDMDEAGAMAIERGMREAMRAELNIKVVLLPEGKDPDDCIKTNLVGWKNAVAKAKPIMEYMFDKTMKDLDLRQINNKRSVATKLLPIINSLGNKIEKDFWLRRLSGLLDISERLLNETLLTIGKPIINKVDGVKKAIIKEQKPETREEKISELLLSILLKFPHLLEYANNHIDSSHLSGEHYVYIYKNLIFYYNNIINDQDSELIQDIGHVFDYNAFRNWYNQEAKGLNLSENQSNIIDRLVLLGDKEFYDIDTEKAKDELITMTINLRVSWLKNRMKIIEKNIQEFERQGDKDSVKENMDEFRMLSEEIKDLLNN